MSRRITLLACVLYCLLLAGFIALNSNLVVLTLPLAIYLVVALYFGPETISLSINRSISTEYISPGKPVKVTLRITNHGSAIDELLIKDEIPAGLKMIEGESKVLISLRPGGSYEFNYTLTGERGNFIFDQVPITMGDALGIFRQKTILSAKGRLMITPELKQLRRVMVRPRRTRDQFGPIPARQGGSGIDFFGVREYQPGDPQRWINWKVAARFEQTLFINEFELERIADVGLVLDARSQSDIPAPGRSLFEYSIQVTASLADAFIRNGNRVGLLIYGHYQEKTFPGYGKVQRDRILRALANAKTSNNLALQSLNYLSTRFFPAHSQIVLISPLSDPDIPVLSQLRALGYSLLLVSPDPVSFEARMYPKNEVVDLARRMAFIERVLLLRKLQRAGMQTIDWDVSKPFDQVAHTILGHLPPENQGVGLI